VRSCGPLSARTFRAGSSNPFVQTSAKIWSKANATQPPYAACFEPTNQRHLCRRLQKPTQIRREDRAVAQSVLCRRLHRIVLRGPYVRSSIHSYSGFLSKELQFSLCLLQTSARQFGGGSVPCADNQIFPFNADICTNLPESGPATDVQTSANGRRYRFSDLVGFLSN
jgi:hypothetical protein